MSTHTSYRSHAGDFVALLETFVSWFQRGPAKAPSVDKDLWRLYRMSAGSDSVRPSAQAWLNQRSRGI